MLESVEPPNMTTYHALKTNQQTKREQDEKLENLTYQYYLLDRIEKSFADKSTDIEDCMMSPLSRQRVKSLKRTA